MSKTVARDHCTPSSCSCYRRFCIKLKAAAWPNSKRAEMGLDARLPAIMAAASLSPVHASDSRPDVIYEDAPAHAREDWTAAAASQLRPTCPMTLDGAGAELTPCRTTVRPPVPVTTWGESHGPAIGCVVDGCPPGLALAEADMQHCLDRRRPGSRASSPSGKSPIGRILSGVFEGVTTGTPIGLLIENVDQRSRDYSEIADSSARATPTTPTSRNTASATIAAAAVRRRARPPCASPPARRAQVLGDGVRIRGALAQIGPPGSTGARTGSRSTDNPFFCPDPATAALWETT